MNEFDLSCVDVTNLDQILMLTIVIILAVERWLGKTKAVQAGSIAEAVENVFKTKKKESTEGQNKGEWDGNFDDERGGSGR